MKITKLKLLSVAMFFGLCIRAQNGMDYSGSASVHYSKLRTSPWLPIFQNANAEKAIGVYQSLITPQSVLEVNTTPAYMPYPMPGLGLGEVFRTNSGGTTSYWRMLRGGTQYGLLFNNNDNHFGLEATQGSLLLLSPNGNIVFKTGKYEITIEELYVLKTEIETLKAEIELLKTKIKV